MAMTPGLCKFALTTHVTSPVGWIGAVAAFLALAIAGVGSQDAQLVRSAYLAMHLITWFVIVPLSLAALSTGIVQSLGTTWGLFDHHRIVTKLLLPILATIILAWRPALARQVTPWGRYVILGIIGLVLPVLLVHLAGGGMRGH
jgi:hypothetical protein